MRDSTCDESEENLKMRFANKEKIEIDRELLTYLTLCEKNRHRETVQVMTDDTTDDSKHEDDKESDIKSDELFSFE